MEHFLANKKIIVAGGGVAGTAFTIAFSALYANTPNPPTIIILERDPQDVAQRRDDYSLSLSGHDETGGLVALKRMGLLDQAVRSAVPGTENGSFKIWDRWWTEKACLRKKPMDGMSVPGIRIARNELRALLHQAAGSHGVEIRWDSQCTSAERTSSGNLRVGVRKGNESTYEEYGDLLIVADGASSKLRAQLRPKETLQYSGAVLRGGLSRFENGIPELLSRDWGFQLSGDGASCFYSPVDKSSLLWVVGHLEPSEAPSFDSNDPKSAVQVIEHARSLGKGFAEPFNTIVNNTNASTALLLNAREHNPLQNHNHMSVMPAILIGDANHALSPFAGYGANLALSDAWDLAEVLCQESGLESAVSNYDARSVPRAKAILKRSRRMLRVGHSRGWRLWVFWLVLLIGELLRTLLGKVKYLTHLGTEYRGKGARTYNRCTKET